MHETFLPRHAIYSLKKKKKINREEEAKDEEWKDDKISGVFLDLSHLTGCPLGQVVQLLK